MLTWWVCAQVMLEDNMAVVSALPRQCLDLFITYHADMMSVRTDHADMLSVRIVHADTMSVRTDHADMVSVRTGDARRQHGGGVRAPAGMSRPLHLSGCRR